jgi:MFS family permease
MSNPGPRTPPAVDRGALAVVAVLVAAQDFLFGLVLLSSMNHYLLDVLHTGSGLPAFTLSLYSVAGFVAQPVAGRLLDQTSSRAVCLTALLTETAGLVVILSIHDLPAFLAGAALLGVGGAAFWPVAFAITARTQPSEARARASAVLSATGFVGTGLGLGVGIALSGAGRWQWPFVAAAIPLLLTAPLLGAPLMRSHHRLESSRLADGPSVRRLALLGLLILLNYGALNGLLGLYGPYARRTLDVSLAKGVFLLAPAGACAAAAFVVGARVSRPERRFEELAILFLLSAIGASLVAIAPSPRAAAVMAPVLVAGLAGVEPILNAAIMDAGGGPSAGFTFGALLSFQRAGTVAGPAIAGAVAQLSNPRWGIGVTVSFLAVSAALAAVLVHVATWALPAQPPSQRPS